MSQTQFETFGEKTTFVFANVKFRLIDDGIQFVASGNLMKASSACFVRDYLMLVLAYQV